MTSSPFPCDEGSLLSNACNDDTANTKKESMKQAVPKDHQPAKMMTTPIRIQQKRQKHPQVLIIPTTTKPNKEEWKKNDEQHSTKESMEESREDTEQQMETLSKNEKCRASSSSDDAAHSSK
eukprot:15338923-Ditylum_brightwellii.AAC.1